MIVPRRQAIPTRLLFGHVRRRARRTFARVRLLGSVPDAPRQVWFGPHRSWWDGLLETLVFGRERLDYTVLMDAANLRRFSFFARTGVAGVDLDATGGRAAALRGLARWLRDGRWGDGSTTEGAFPAGPDAHRVALVFPHGRLTVADEPPPPFRDGAGALARLADAVAVPYAKRLLFRGDARPEAYFLFGEPIPGAEAARPGRAEDALRAVDETLRARCAGATRPRGIDLIPPAPCPGAPEEPEEPAGAGEGRGG